MQKRLLNEAEAYAKRNHRRQVWRKLVRMMACVVVFCTTYALILPAITMERSQCELEEHIHSESCYAKVTTRQQQTLSCTYDSLSVHQHTPECRDGEGALICGYRDYLVHEHDAACTDEAGILVCQLPVVKAHTHTEEDCFAPVEMETEHIHDDTCYTLQRGELLCQIEETPGHAHGDECYTLGELQCQLEEREGHTHTETCTEKILLCDLTVEPHVHTDACYRQLTCDLSTEPAHTHTDACTGRVLECQQTEQPHIHTDECYQVNDLCGQEEQEGHTHTRACYASELTSATAGNRSCWIPGRCSGGRYRTAAV